MSDRAALKSLTATYSTALGQYSRQRTRGLLAFRSIGPIALCSDVVIIVGMSLLSGMLYHLAVFSQFGAVETFFGVGALTAVNFSAFMAAGGAYKPETLGAAWKQVRETSEVMALRVLCPVGDGFHPEDQRNLFARRHIDLFCGRMARRRRVALAYSRFIAQTLAEGGFAEQKTILLAEKGQLEGSHVVDELRRCGYRPVGTFELPESEPSAPNGPSQLFDLAKEIIELSRAHAIECVFLLVSWDNRTAVEQSMGFLRSLSIPVYLLPDRNVAHYLGNRIINVGTTWTAELKRAPLSPGEQAVKRAMDILLASLLLFMLAPVMVLVALCIKLESRGPALFIQTRNGFNGRPFRIYKFRTMSVLEDGPVIRQATRNDPRVTQLGRVLRRTNVDELPQLFNVLAGDMSLVGPRPHAAAHNSEYEQIIANYAYRYHVKPGLTGWAQVHGLRGETQTIRSDGQARRVRSLVHQ